MAKLNNKEIQDNINMEMGDNPLPRDAHSNVWIDFVFLAIEYSLARVVAISGVDTTWSISPHCTTPESPVICTGVPGPAESILRAL